MAAVGVVAVLLWGAMMGAHSYDYYRRAREYGAHERGWREIAVRKVGNWTFALQCAEYYEQLARKYRQAMWRPWMPVAPDPYAPGAYEYMMSQWKKILDGVVPDLDTPGIPPSQNP
jgi:hypothetical protein